MNQICLSQLLSSLLPRIIAKETLHARWLNTLSYLENCGARKIAACEHPTLVKEEMLKHAAEEFRHAHHLKKQIQRVSISPFDHYLPAQMLGGIATLHYLSKLDLETARYLKKSGNFSKEAMKEASYLLVTYAIELRAEQLYPLYDAFLRKAGSKVTVKSILLEEKEHLNEMREGIQKMQQGFAHAAKICELEEALSTNWLIAVEKDIA